MSQHIRNNKSLFFPLLPYLMQREPGAELKIIENHCMF